MLRLLLRPRSRRVRTPSSCASKSSIAFRLSKDAALGNVSSLPQRAGLERARSISSWVKDYGIVLDV